MSSNKSDHSPGAPVDSFNRAMLQTRPGTSHSRPTITIEPGCSILARSLYWLVQICCCIALVSTLLPHSTTLVPVHNLLMIIAVSLYWLVCLWSEKKRRTLVEHRPDRLIISSGNSVNIESNNRTSRNQRLPASSRLPTELTLDPNTSRDFWCFCILSAKHPLTGPRRILVWRDSIPNHQFRRLRARIRLLDTNPV